MALNQGSSPTCAKAGARTGHEKELGTVVVLQIAAVVGLTLAGAMFGESAVYLLTPPDYHAPRLSSPGLCWDTALLASTSCP